MEYSKKRIVLTFTLLSLAAAVLILFSYIGTPAYMAVSNFISDQEAGGFRWLSLLFHSPWTDTLVQYAFIMGAAYVPARLLISRLPKVQKQGRPIPLTDFVLCMTAALGLGYILNIVGTGINMLVSTYSGKDLYEMNPVLEMAMDMSPSMIIYGCLLGPFMEELMFRGFLLKRARVYGDRTAVVFTAVVFGLMHGNLAQFLYATAIGLLLGYTVVKTNRMRYAVVIHMFVNIFNQMLVMVETMLMHADSEVPMILFSMAVLFLLLFFMAAAVVILIKNGRLWFRQMTVHNGPKSWKKAFVYLNPGFVFYVFLCVEEMLRYLL